MNQLGLPISLDSKMLLDNFIANNELVNLINQLFLDKKASEIYVYGLSGQGKTHVLQGVVLKALENDKNAIYIDCTDPFPEHLFDFINQLSFISFDNVDLISNENQETFFDLYNRARQAGVVILVSGSGLPADLNVMKDLKTRLSLAAVYKLEELNDELTIDVLNKQMSDRNLTIDSKIYEYLFKNYSRDLNTLVSAMNELDKASLQSKKAISIPFVKSVLHL
ncbi:MAG: DnaA family protein [Candidatus Pseudothioglobus sp.]|jgi:DnaA family protein|tara:strand:- start:338 stop:1006 length:669 start_codon:yes stop_codon:yes gene_type:complete